MRVDTLADRAQMPFVIKVGVVAFVTLSVALACRTYLIEVPEYAWACQDNSGAPWWCVVHKALFSGLRSGALGVISLIAGIVAICGGGRFVTAVAIVIGSAGLILYAAGASAVGLILGALRAVRL